MKSIFVWLLMLPGITSLAQTVFEKSYGDPVYDNGLTTVTACRSGGYLLSGATSTWYMGAGVFESRFQTTYLVRTDDNGDTLWTRHHDVDDVGFCLDMFENPDGSFFLVSMQYTQSCGGISVGGTSPFYQYQVSRLDANGNLVNTNPLVSTCDYNLTGAIALRDGNFVVYGRANNFATPSNAAAFHKFDPFGNIIWTRYPSGLQSGASLATMIEKPNGELMAIGRYGTDSLRIVTMDSLGLNEVIRYDSVGLYFLPNQLIEKPNGGFKLWCTKTVIDTVNGNYDKAVSFDVDAAGTTITNERVYEFGFRQALQHTDTTTLITCHELQESGRGPYSDTFSIQVRQLDVNGNVEWIRSYGTDSNDYAVMAVATPDGGYAVGGIIYFANLQTISSKYYLAKDTIPTQQPVSVRVPEGVEHHLYPNPLGNSSLVISGDQLVHARFFDVTGRQTGEARLQSGINHLSRNQLGNTQGLILYEIQNADGATTFGKLLVE